MTGSIRGGCHGVSWCARVVRSVALLAIGGALLCACDAPPPDTLRVDLPLTSVIDTPLGDFATVAMGDLSSPDETFWQLFARAPGATRWSLATPPGVATNGGIVVTTEGRALVAGVLPSQALTFSPVELTTDRGRTWSVGVLPGGLAHVPDAIAGGPGLLALLTAHGGEVVERDGGLSQWRTIATTATLSATARRSKQCAVTTLTAVGWVGSEALVAGSCASGRAEVFVRVGTAWDEAAQAPLPGTVARFDSGGALTATLLGTGRSGVRLVQFGRPLGARAAIASSLLAATAPWGVVATGDSVVVVRDGAACTADGTLGGRRVRLLALPVSACAVLSAGGGELVALDPGRTQLAVYDGQLGAGRTVTWQFVQRRHVPIQFGSSS